VDDYEVTEQGFELLPACGDAASLSLYAYDQGMGECRKFSYDSGTMRWGDAMAPDTECCAEAAATGSDPLVAACPESTFYRY